MLTTFSYNGGVILKKIDFTSKNHYHCDNSFIHPNATIGDNVLIGPNSSIGENVIIGNNCIIGPLVTIKGWTTIGTGNKFYPGAIIGCEPQNLAFKGEKTFLTIGNNNSFRENATVSVGTVEGGGETRIGDNNLIMNYSHIAHDCQIGNNVVITNSVNMAGNVIIEDRARIGGLTGIRQFCRIGKMAMVGFMTKITKDVPPYMLVDGDPPEIYGLNIVGLRRNEIYPEVRILLKKAYRILYRSNLKIEDAIKRIEQELESTPEIIGLIGFLKESKLGVLGF